MTSSGWNEPWEVAPPYSDNQNPGTENFGLYDLPNVIVNTGNTSIEWESSAMYFNAHTINIAPGYYGGLGAVSVEMGLTSLTPPSSCLNIGVQMLLRLRAASMLETIPCKSVFSFDVYLTSGAKAESFLQRMCHPSGQWSRYPLILQGVLYRSWDVDLLCCWSPFCQSGLRLLHHLCYF